jgi:chromosome segregation ATPase
MTYLKKLRMNGFKSFSKNTEIVFDPNLSIIIGPNGSGKSNVTDAICFVLGRLGTKSMRASRAANLIYNGGKTKKGAEEAFVELVLDNSEKTFATNDSELRISRTVRKSGISIYKINDETTTRQSVVDVLAQAAIDPEGFNIVLQEEISRFVEMSHQERRLVIEEVAGISIYEERKQKSLQELEKTDDRLKEVSTILHERSAYLRNLDRERSEALKYENLKKSIARCRATILHKQITEKSGEKKKVDEVIDSKDIVIKKVREQVIGYQDKISRLNKHINEINIDVERATGVQSEQLHTDITQFKADLAGLSVRLETFTNQLSNLNEREKQMRETFKKEVPELEILKKEKEKIKKKLQKISFETFKSELFGLVSELKKATGSTIESVGIMLDKIRTHIGKIGEMADVIKIKEAVSQLSGIINKEYKQSDIALQKLNECFNNITSLTGLEIKDSKEDTHRDVELQLFVKQSEIDKMQLLLKKFPDERQELEKRISNIKSQVNEKEKLVKDKDKQEKDVYLNFQKLFAKRTGLQDEVRKFEEQMIAEQEKMRQIEDDNNAFKISRAKVEAELETIGMEFEPFKEYDIIHDVSVNELNERIRKDEEALHQIGSVNLRALDVYDSVKGEYEKIYEKVKKLQEEKEEVMKMIAEIDRKKKRTFLKVLDVIGRDFTTNFLKLTAKTAELEMENKENPFEGGLTISVRIAKGKSLDVSSLSGGERALVALSLIFAIQDYKPYHFYVFDEIDAALDKRNSERLANLIKENIRKAQYIIISHNDSVINEGNTLYGVSMQEGVSKVVGLKI